MGIGNGVCVFAQHAACRCEVLLTMIHLTPIGFQLSSAIPIPRTSPVTFSPLLSLPPTLSWSHSLLNMIAHTYNHLIHLFPDTWIYLLSFVSLYLGLESYTHTPHVSLMNHLWFPLITPPNSDIRPPLKFTFRWIQPAFQLNSLP